MTSSASAPERLRPEVSSRGAASAAPRLSPHETPGDSGLSSAEARRRLAELGPNELSAGLHVGALRRVARSVLSPLMLILFAASGVAAWAGQVIDAAIIAVTVALSILLDAVQTARSTGAAERLRQSVVPLVTVRRDGAWVDLPRPAIVPGDVIRLGAGTLVPADARLLESRDLHVHEAALTGESLPAEKEVGQVVFLGTSVVAGTATGLVTATGRRTEYGDIAARLRDAPPETAFERDLRDLSRLLGETVIFLVLFLLLVNVVLRRDPLESLLFAVALAVGIIPEFMPMITTLTLASGAVRMARRRVIVKHLGAIQNLGGIDILCSDKTGTLTEGRMTLDRAVDASGRDSASVRELAVLTARFGSGVRNPLDDAILASAPPDDGAWRKVDEIPFDFERRRASVVVERGAERRLVMKGAPRRCSTPVRATPPCATRCSGSPRRRAPRDFGCSPSHRAPSRRRRPMPASTSGTPPSTGCSPSPIRRSPMRALRSRSSPPTASWSRFSPATMPRSPGTSASAPACATPPSCSGTSSRR
jgi:ATPase, P-type (transporting), HAD superfamily, subfamily IC